MIQGGSVADHGQHAPDAGRQFSIYHVQFAIRRALSLVTVRAQIVGALQVRRTDDSQHGFSTQFQVVGRMATATGKVALVGTGGRKLQ